MSEREANAIAAQQACINAADRLAELLPMAVHSATTAGGFLTSAEERDCEEAVAVFKTLREAARNAVRPTTEQEEG